MSDWYSAWKPFYDSLVAEGPSPHVAVAQALQFGERLDIPTPRFYVSTAITSAGWRRHPDLHDPSRFPEAVARDDRTASLILSALVDKREFAGQRALDDGPTDLGKVPGWCRAGAGLEGPTS